MENLICTNCKKKLEEIEGEVCCINCNKNFGSFPILNFVEEAYTSSFGFQWNLFQKTQLDSYNNLNLSKKRLFVGTKWKEELNKAGDVVAEKLGITISDNVYKKVLDKNYNLTDVRTFMTRLNEEYMLSVD